MSDFDLPDLPAETIEAIHAAGDDLPSLRDQRKLWRWARETDTSDVLQTFAEAVQMRANGKPVSKIIGSRDFWKRSFEINDDVLDPRPDTETLVETALELPFDSVLDLGTGSGCILVSLLDDRPSAQGIGTDISDAALAVARRNGAHNARASFMQSDWFEKVTGRFDLIVSNPPYIAQEEMGHLSREVRDHDPYIALSDASDGLSVYRMLAEKAPDYLEDGGHLVVEIGWSQGRAVCDIFRSARFAQIALITDLAGKERVVRAKWDKNAA